MFIFLRLGGLVGCWVKHQAKHKTYWLNAIRVISEGERSVIVIHKCYVNRHPGRESAARVGRNPVAMDGITQH